MIQGISLVIPALCPIFGNPLVPMALPQRWVGVFSWGLQIHVVCCHQRINEASWRSGGGDPEVFRGQTAGRKVVGDFVRETRSSTLNSWDLEEFVATGPIMFKWTTWIFLLGKGSSSQQNHLICLFLLACSSSYWWCLFFVRYFSSLRVFLNTHTHDTKKTYKYFFIRTNYHFLSPYRKKAPSRELTYRTWRKGKSIKLFYNVPLIGDMWSFPGG